METYSEWQAVLADAVRDPVELIALLQLPPELLEAARRAGGDFPLLVPRPYLARIRPGDPKDPLLLQILPIGEELVHHPRFVADPLGEVDGSHPPGVLAKYQNRILMVSVGSCGVHCRFCFRRHFPYESAVSSPERWGAAIAHVERDSAIHEVILSGGDPLTLSDERLSGLLEQLSQIPHVRRVRLHTRMPIVIPQRVTGELTSVLRSTRLAAWMVVHVNHPAEIDAAVAEAVGRLVDGGVPLLSQSVLLRGVNDRVEVLASLCERLVDLRVTPYYLHQLDRVAGAAHFEVPEETGIRLVEELRRRLPGYAVPRYVRETPGDACKRALI
jgi:EF-P beta-lysylation protein EpmB